MISAWSVFNKWLVTTSNSPLNNKSTSQFVRHPDMVYGRNGYNWMGVIPDKWTVSDYTGTINW
jgi:hypothetical protein